MNDTEKVIKYLDNYVKNVDRVLDKTLKESADAILEESRLLVPVESGQLRDESDVKKQKEFEYHVNYNMDYAYYIHENLELIHNTGQAKFLESVTLKQGNGIVKKIADNIGKCKG